MSRLIAVILVAMLALVAAGCAPAEDQAVDQPPPGEAAPAPDPAALAGDPEAAAEGNVLSPLPEQPFEPFSTDETLVPQEILDRLETQQPMLLFFHDATQRSTNDQREAIDAVLADHRGLIDMIAFDVGKYVTTDASGKITAKPELLEDPTTEKVARLISSDHLNVTYTPYLVFVDGQGHITHRYRGYVDERLIEREILRATQ